MKSIVIVASTYRQAVFFSRFRNALLMLNIKMIVIVLQYSALKLLQGNQIEAYMPTKCDKCNMNDKDLKFYEVYTGRLSLKSCINLYCSTQKLAIDIVEHNNVYAIFIFNGENVEQKAVSDIAKKHNLPTLFFEIANIPGKIYVDRFGTNAHSELYANPEILDLLPDCHEEYLKWKSSYLLQKRKINYIPQRRSKYSDLSVKNIQNLWGMIRYSNLGYDKQYVKKKIYNAVINLFGHFDFDEFDYTSNEYIFFPMQVTYDTQVMVNSNISVFEALEYAIRKADNEGKILVVKPHPQESDTYILSALKKLRQKNNFFIVNDNVFSILDNASEVVTINSTVGLEAMILGKNIDVLGRAMYVNFNESRLERYICEYLVDIDFWNDKYISEADIKGLIQRI